MAGRLGGCLLVTLGLLAEYGAFEILQYQTFTVEIFTEFKLGFNAVAACTLSLVLVVLSVAVLGGELALSGRGGPSAPARASGGSHRAWRWDAGAFPPWRLSPLSRRSPSECRWEHWGTGSLMAARARCRRPRSSLRAGHTALYSAAAAVLATLLAIPVAPWRSATATA